MENFKLSRIKAVVVNLVFMLAASLPCVFGYNILSNLHLIGGRDVLDSEDFIVSNLLLPIGAMIFVIFCSWKFGWGADRFIEETNTGTGMRMGKKLVPYFKYILPLLILFVMVMGLLPK